MDNVSSIKKELMCAADDKKAQILMRFFKTAEGEYGEGDIFIGVVVPVMRSVAKKYFNKCSLGEMEKLLQEDIHEFRITAIFLMTYLFERSKDDDVKESIINSYIRNIEYVNNWDLVDLSAYKLLGVFLENKDRSLLYEYAQSNELWKERISIIATLHFIRKKDYKDTLKLAKILLTHKHDLIHKAVGWMLREIGKRDLDQELSFLKEYYKVMPRTMLRYAIEKFDEPVRQKFLKGTF